jgi:hypothetical protein
VVPYFAYKIEFFCIGMSTRDIITKYSTIVSEIGSQMKIFLNVLLYMSSSFIVVVTRVLLVAFSSKFLTNGADAICERISPYEVSIVDIFSSIKLKCFL